MMSDEDMGKLIDAFYHELKPEVLRVIGEMTEFVYVVAPDDADSLANKVVTVAFAKYVAAMICAAAENRERDNEMFFWTAVDGASITFDNAIKEIAKHIWPKVQAEIEANRVKAATAGSADAATH